jgi:hypothetical protein
MADGAITDNTIVGINNKSRVSKLVINLVVWGKRWLHQLPTPPQQAAAGESATTSHGSCRCGSRTHPWQYGPS